MSVANAKMFFDQVEKDPKLQKKVGKSFAGIVKTANKAGYEFSSTDMRKHLRRRWGITKPPAFSETDECTM